MTLEEYKSKKSGHTVSDNSYTNGLVKRTLVTALIVTLLLVGTVFSDKFKDLVTKYLLETNFEFSKINAFYQKYFSFGDEARTVSNNEMLVYNSSERYNDGVKLIVEDGYNVSLLESGIVVFIGEKEGYGNTIIVQQSNGIDAWYSGIEDSSVTIYDYIEKGTIIGVANEELVLAFQKDGEFLDYENYIK